MSIYDDVLRVSKGSFIVLDTETTGLNDAEIVEIAIVNESGESLLNTYVRPKNRIPLAATAVNGITDEMVAAAPTFLDLIPTIIDLLRGRDVIVYNAVFDRKMLHQSAEAWGFPHTDYKSFSRWWCAMEAYAILHGDYNAYRGTYKWQRLATAAQRFGITNPHPHRAMGDALTTLAVVKAMGAAWQS